jgi:predicted DNA-binding protein YlxM (UPF0122 family)
MPTKQKTHYTITEAAKKLKLSRQAVHKAIKRKLLNAEWGEVTQKALLISAESIRSYQVSKPHQDAGKKND